MSFRHVSLIMVLMACLGYGQTIRAGQESWVLLDSKLGMAEYVSTPVLTDHKWVVKCMSVYVGSKDDPTLTYTFDPVRGAYYQSVTHDWVRVESSAFLLRLYNYCHITLAKGSSK